MNNFSTSIIFLAVTKYPIGFISTWLSGSMVTWLVGHLVRWLSVHLVGWLSSQVAYWFSGHMASWLLNEKSINFKFYDSIVQDVLLYVQKYLAKLSF